jgi:hypothetical protein
MGQAAGLQRVESGSQRQRFIRYEWDLKKVDNNCIDFDFPVS